MRAILKNTARERANQNARKPVSLAARVIMANNTDDLFCTYEMIVHQHTDTVCLPYRMATG